jgi:hypothetical protein
LQLTKERKEEEQTDIRKNNLFSRDLQYKDIVGDFKF